MGKSPQGDAVIEDAKEKQGIQVIARAASILYSLEGQPDGLSLSDLASRLGLARTTVQRIVGALLDEQLLIGAGARGRVTLGPRLVRLAAHATMATSRVAQPIMQALSLKLGETVDLSVLQGGNAQFVEQVQGASRLVAVSAVGDDFPLHCTANGKALLGCIERDKRRALLGPRLRRLTDATIVDPECVLAEVNQFLETQIAWDREEHAEGICAVGTAFIDPTGRDFALSVPVPASRFLGREQDIADAILDARESIIARLPGARTPAPDR